MTPRTKQNQLPTEGKAPRGGGKADSKQHSKPAKPSGTKAKPAASKGVTKAKPAASKGVTKAKPAASKGVTKAKPAAPKGVSFIVSSLQEYPQDGFHSFHPGTRKTDSVHKTLNAANKRARELFYKENPWGWGAKEMEDGMDIDEDADSNGCVTLSACPEDSEMWEVKVEIVASKK